MWGCFPLSQAGRVGLTCSISPHLEHRGFFVNRYAFGWPGSWGTSTQGLGVGFLTLTGGERNFLWTHNSLIMCPSVAICVQDGHLAGFLRAQKGMVKMVKAQYKTWCGGQNNGT